MTMRVSKTRSKTTLCNPTVPDAYKVVGIGQKKIDIIPLEKQCHMSAVKMDGIAFMYPFSFIAICFVIDSI